MVFPQQMAAKDDGKCGRGCDEQQHFDTWCSLGDPDKNSPEQFIKCPRNARWASEQIWRDPSSMDMVGFFVQDCGGSSAKQAPWLFNSLCLTLEVENPFLFRADEEEDFLPRLIFAELPEVLQALTLYQDFLIRLSTELMANDEHFVSNTSCLDVFILIQHFAFSDGVHAGEV